MVANRTPIYKIFSMQFLHVLIYFSEGKTWNLHPITYRLFTNKSMIYYSINFSHHCSQNYVMIKRNIYISTTFYNNINKSVPRSLGNYRFRIEEVTSSRLSFPNIFFFPVLQSRAGGRLPWIQAPRFPESQR